MTSNPYTPERRRKLERRRDMILLACMIAVIALAVGLIISGCGVFR